MRKMFWILVVATFVVIAGSVTYFGWFYESANSEKPSNNLVDSSAAKLSSTSKGSGDVISSAAVSALPLKIDSKGTIKQIIALRKQSSSKDIVKIAESISLLNEKIRKTGNTASISAWQETTACVYDSCADYVYIKLMDAVAAADLNDKTNKVIHSAVETYMLWDGKNVIYFSESLDKTNKLIRDLNQPSINIIWDDIVQCNGKCASFSDKTITLIERIVG